MHDTRTLWNSRYANRAAQSVLPPADPWLSRWLDLLKPAREGMILDLGCGEGRTCRYLADCGFRHLLAADQSDEALKICRPGERAASQYLVLDMRERLPFPMGISRWSLPVCPCITSPGCLRRRWSMRSNGVLKMKESSSYGSIRLQYQLRRRRPSGDRRESLSGAWRA